MPKKEKRITPSDSGFFNDIAIQGRLVLRLIADPRVSFLLKLLPIGSLIYLIVPIDLFPINPIDDAVIIGLGTYMFIELCPQDVVKEHRDALRQVVAGTWKDPEENNDEVIDASDILEGEFREKK
jgi:uncharacterized membrane protein YkvA (DUF1232 family)